MVIKINTADLVVTHDLLRMAASKWGLLKSYQKNRNGWVSLDYAKRV